jgi:two-component sensor histidine kinase
MRNSSYALRISRLSCTLLLYRDIESPMKMSDVKTTAVVEQSSNEDVPDMTRKALEQRIRQQEILSELGVLALQGATFDNLLDETVRLTAEGLDVQFCKILRHIPHENRLLVAAGVGWDKGIVGVASIGADLASPAGFALRTGKAVISNHLENEERFRTPDLLAQHGIRRAMNVILQGDGKPFGVLEVDSKSDQEFVEHDLAFLQGAANVLGMAIERERNERHLKDALARQQFLVKEMNHRVKNSLAIVSSLIQMQGRRGNGDSTDQFEETARRVNAIARAHERLYRNNYIESMDLGAYIEEVCQDMDSSVIQCTVKVEAQRGINVKVDNAISIALIVVELVTNSAKYAYPDGTGGEIGVSVQREGDKNILIAVCDEGVGFPDGFDPQKSRGLGMQIVRAFAKQLHTTMTFNNRTQGSEAKFLFPIGTA